MPLVRKRSFSPEEVSQMGDGQAAPGKRSFSPEEVDSMDPSGSRAQGMDLLKKFNDAGDKTANPEFFNDALHGASNALDVGTLGNLQYSPAFRQELEEAKRESPASSLLGKGLGYLGLGALSPEAPLLVGAAQGALTRPEGDSLPQSEDIQRRIVNGAIGMGTGGALKLAGAGVGRLGDWAMQKAVGMNQFEPGIGTRMADEGLVGTRGFMQKQISGPGEDPGFVDQMMQKMGITNKLAAREADIQRAIPQVQGQVSAVPSSSAIDRIGAQYVPKNPSLEIPTANQPFVDAAHQRSLEAVARGPLSPADALNVARTVDRAAYDTGSPMGRFQRNLGKADSGALRSAVKDAATSQGIPAVANGLGSEQALISARNAMEGPQPMGMDLIRHHLYRGLPGVVIGDMVGHGIPGMVAGGMATEALSSPLGMSMIGQAATKGSQALPYMQPGFVDQMVRRSMEDDQ